MNYGIPYMGSKSKICEDICRLFPRADNFYDLFGGGFSITHFMLKHRSKDYKQFHFNEIRNGMSDLVKDAIDGKYNYENYKPEWISREEFAKRIDTDLFVKIIWSFGNNGKGYLFGKDIEQQKKSLHMAIVFNEFDQYAKDIFGMEKFKEGFSVTDKRLLLKNRLRYLSKDRCDLEQLEQLERLQRLEQLEQLQRLQRLHQLAFYSGSYSEVPIKENSVIYCDIPYQGTSGYDKNSSFNHAEFFNWANAQTNPVFISEYNVSDSRFKLIANFKKRSLLSPNKDTTLIKTEKVYVNKAGYEKLMRGRNVV
jgi:site-specific DNA-adenine methylase